MSEEWVTYKDSVFEINNVLRVIRNVPVINHNNYPEAYDLDTALKLAMIRDLMRLNEIPNEVDYKLVEDFEL